MISFFASRWSFLEHAVPEVLEGLVLQLVQTALPGRPQMECTGNWQVLMSTVHKTPR